MVELHKKRSMLLYILLLSFFLLEGCNKTEIEEKAKGTIGTTDWPEEISYCMTGLPNIAFSGDKELYVEEGIMHIRDSKSGADAVLCTRLNCTHPSHSATGGGSHCEATSPPNAFGDFEAVALHGDTVFQFFQTEDNLNNTQLYVSHVGQSGRKKATTLPYKVSSSSHHLYFEGNHLYFTAHQEEEDEVQGTKTRCVLLQMNLDTYEITELDESISNAHIQIGSVDYSNGVLAYEIVQQDKDNYYSKVHLYNVQTKEKIVLDSLEFHYEHGYSEYLGYYQGDIYYVSEKGNTIIKRKVDSGEEICIATLKKGRVFYNCNMSYSIGIEYETSAPNTMDADHWDSADKRMYYYSFQNGKTYPVKQKYTKVNGMLGMLSKNTAYYLELKDDKIELKRISSEEYLDKEEK